MIRMHFLNVGRGDCTIIEHESGRVTMVDINNSEYVGEEKDFNYKNPELSKFLAKLNTLRYIKEYNIKLTDPIEYYKNFVEEKIIFRFILTHPDMDHLSGLYNLIVERDNKNLDVLNFWDTNNTEEKEEPWGIYNKEDWETYQDIRDGKYNFKVLVLNGASLGKYFNKDDMDGNGDQIYIWAPDENLDKMAKEKNNTNYYSYVLLINYYHRRIILGGDAVGGNKNEESAWQYIYDLNSAYSVPMKADILKASHHGLNSGYHQPSVSEISPIYTVISTGKKTKNDASSKYGNYCDNVLSTRYWGNILIEVEQNGDIRVYTEKDRNNLNINHYYFKEAYWFHSGHTLN